MAAYELFLRRDALTFLQGCRPADRQRLWKVLDDLIERPHADGDFQEMDPTGRRLEVKVVGRLAVKELKVVEVRPADLG